MLPEVSVILPVYNADLFLEESIQSILGQFYSDIELIVVNDGSSDRSADIISGWAAKDVRLKVFNQQNAGLVSALNKGIELANGKYIARMDADDIAVPDRLGKQVAYLEANPDISVLGTQMEIFGDDVKKYKRSKYPTQPSRVLKELQAGRNPICHPSVMMRRSTLNDIGGYRSFFTSAEDYDLWLRLSEVSGIANLPEVLLRYRQHGGSITATKAQQQNFSRGMARFASEKRKQGFQDPIDAMGGAINLEKLEDIDLRAETSEVLNAFEIYSAILNEETDFEAISASEQERILLFLSKGYLGGGRKVMSRYCERVFVSAMAKKQFHIARVAITVLGGLSRTRYYKFLLKNAVDVVSAGIRT